MQDALFPLRRTWISQGMGGATSHLDTLAIDFGVLSSDRDYDLHAPFDGTVVFVDSVAKGAAVAFQSDAKVRFADGTEDFMTVITGHDNTPPKVGSHFLQGEVYSHMGTAGGVGKHAHMEVQRGKFAKWNSFTRQGYYRWPNTIAPYLALWLPADAIIDATASVVKYDWKRLPTVTPTVLRNSNKNQVKVLVDLLRVRDGHSVSAQLLGYAVRDGIYDWHDRKQGSLTWYRIADGQWIASDGTWLEELPKSEDYKREYEAALKKIAELEAKISKAKEALT